MLLILGPYPPPYGGVSNHISRILPYLKSRGIEHSVYNQYSVGDSSKNVYPIKNKYIWWIKFLIRPQNNLVHFHQFSWLHFQYFLLYSLFNSNRFLLTIHNERLLTGAPILRAISIFCLKFTKCLNVIVVSESVYKKLKLYGIEGLVHLPAYVPPITKSIRNKIKRKYTVFFNIWKVDSRKSVTVYGIDLLIEIASLYPDIQFECFVSSEKNLRLLYDSINQRKVKNIEVVVGENLVSHFSRADLFLRLNRDDAYGVSIQEALDCGVPAIASDVCLRPRGALLFESGNLKQLKAVFERALSLPRHTLISERLSTKYHLELIDIYRRNLGR